MLIIQVCVGSSCHLKGAPEIVELLQQKISQQNLHDDIVLSGMFCAGKCNRIGVTITVGDEVYTGVTPASFEDFWQSRVVPALQRAKEA